MGEIVFTMKTRIIFRLKNGVEKKNNKKVLEYVVEEGENEKEVN